MLGTELTNGNSGKLIITDTAISEKFLLPSTSCALYVGNFLAWGCIKRATFVLIKWENYGTFLS